MCNLKLDDVFTDVFGKSASRIINAIIEHGSTDFDVVPMIDGRCRASVEDVRAALDGDLAQEQISKLDIIRQHKDCIDFLQDELETLILKLAEPFTEEISLLLTVPGIKSPLTAVRILAEIGADMSVFETSKRLCSWAGLTPQNQESAGKKKTTRIGRAGAYLKPLLVQCSLAVAKSDKHPELKNKFQSLKKRRGGKKAVIAISRKLLTAIWHILEKKEAYNAELYQKADKPPTSRELTPEQAFSLLRRKGYVILGDDVLPDSA
jgi:transposase